MSVGKKALVKIQPVLYIHLKSLCRPCLVPVGGLFSIFLLFRSARLARTAAITAVGAAVLATTRIHTLRQLLSVLLETRT